MDSVKPDVWDEDNDAISEIGDYSWLSSEDSTDLLLEDANEDADECCDDDVEKDTKIGEPFS